MPPRKNISLRLPEALVDGFSEAARRECGPKKQWIAASAALLMYAEADEQTRREFRRRAADLALDL